MSAERFTLDTNILVYSIDNAAGIRRTQAREIVRRAVRLDCRLTLQAMSEFYAVVTRKHGVAPALVAMQVRDWLSAFPSIAASEMAVRAALVAAVERRTAYWDALLIATAAEAGCTAILTEDMADGTVVDGVRIIHPFGADGLTEAAAALLGG
jgi:predicted nucleic acid-binding protein